MLYKITLVIQATQLRNPPTLQINSKVSLFTYLVITMLTIKSVSVNIQKVDIRQAKKLSNIEKNYGKDVKMFYNAELVVNLSSNAELLLPK